MRLFPVGLASAAVVTAGAFLLRCLIERRERLPAPSPGKPYEPVQDNLVDRLRQRGI